jgi:hypothetical protein
MTLFASRHLWPDFPKLHRHARQHGVWLTDRGEVILDGEGVGTYELAGGALVFHDIQPQSPLVEIFDLRQVE